VVLSGDVPLLSSKAVRLLLDAVESGAEAALLTAVLDDPGAYGRVVRGADRSVCEVVEARDAAPQVLAIKEVNAGVYAFRRQTLTTALSSLTPDNAQRSGSSSCRSPQWSSTTTGR
jgi:bifunctional UDP-N-acetylglucosamine pyrophosphorylase/glucosamine-1-phosphate N-acetyltransferase